MQERDDSRLRITADRARWTLEELADELPYASPDDREALRAGIDFERWLLENCQTVWESRAP
jgi:hypothetical protein